MSFSKLTNLLDLTEIRTHIAQYLSVKDAISCVRVSKEWSKDFVHRIWHTVDFDVHVDFDNISTDIVMKHGDHIRSVKNIKKVSHIKSLSCDSVSRIFDLEIYIDWTSSLNALSSDLIFRNNTSLTSLVVQDPFEPPDALSQWYFSVNPLIPRAAAQSKLTRLNIGGVYLTRESFVLLLRECISLVTLEIWETKLDSGTAFGQYQHYGIKELRATPELVTGAASGLSTNSPLFTHFPNLEKWLTFVYQTDSVQDISDGVGQWWPKLREINTNYSEGAIVADLLANIYRPLTSITVHYSAVSSNFVHAVLLHQEALQNIATYTGDGDSDNEGDMGIGHLQEVNDHFRDSGWIIQSILRQCPKLTSFKFPGHEMDMDLVERSRWSCTGLRCLHTRIRHLDTKEKIDAAITRLISARESGTNIDPYDKSIEARVACHLLKFDKLTKVWLGTEIFEC